MRWEGNVVRMGERRDAYRVLVGEPVGKRVLGRPGRRCSGVPRGGLGCSNPPKIPKALQNLAKLNPIVKTVKNC